MSLAPHITAALARHLAEHGTLIARETETLCRTNAIVDRLLPELPPPGIHPLPSSAEIHSSWDAMDRASQRKALFRAIKPRMEAKVRARDASATYSERAFFDGDPCQHCADRDEHLRLNRLRQDARVRRVSFDAFSERWADRERVA